MIYCYPIVYAFSGIPRCVFSMENPFKSIFSLFGKGGKSVFGVDIGSSSVKVVQIRKKGGRAILETYGELALGPYAALEVGRATSLPPEKIAEAVVDIMREAKITTKSCGMAIPTASSLVSLIEMPALDSRQLAEMVPLEARKYIPVPVSEVTLDWWIIPKEEDRSLYMAQSEANQVQKGKQVNVLLVAILNDALNRYREIVKLSGLECSFFEIEIFSTIRAVLDQTDISPVMIIDIGAGVTKLSIVERSIVKNSHTISRGSQDITLGISRSSGIAVVEAERLKRAHGLAKTEAGQDLAEIAAPVFNFIFSEARRVLLNYEKKFNSNVSKVILTGGGSSIKGLFPLARESFQTTVIAANPFLKVEAPAFLEEVLKNVGPSFSVALGIALRRLSETE